MEENVYFYGYLVSRQLSDKPSRHQREVKLAWRTGLQLTEKIRDMLHCLLHAVLFDIFTMWYCVLQHIAK